MSMNIAIIGGVGSGKTEVLKVAREMGIAALSADEINAELLKNPQYVEKVARIFPDCVVCGVREALNAVAQPELAKKVTECDADPLVVELPLVLESGMATMFDEIILVVTPRRLRVKRLEQRGIDSARAKAIMRAQKPIYSLRRVATRTIDNSGSLDNLREASRNLLRIFCE